MLLIEGAIVRMKKEIKGYKVLRNELFKITDIDGIFISFASLDNSLGKGIMSTETFNNYFEVISEGEYVYDNEIFKYNIVNERTIKVRYKDKISGFAYCRPEDKFNLETGLKIACIRAKINWNLHEKLKLEKELISYLNTLYK